MYRSDTEGTAAVPSLPQPVIHVPAPVAPTRAEPARSLPPPPPPPAPSRERGWIESGLYVMTLPLTMTLGIMMAPVTWFFGGRPRE